MSRQFLVNDRLDNCPITARQPRPDARHMNAGPLLLDLGAYPAQTFPNRRIAHGRCVLRPPFAGNIVLAYEVGNSQMGQDGHKLYLTQL